MSVDWKTIVRTGGISKDNTYKGHNIASKNNRLEGKRATVSTVLPALLPIPL